MTFRVLVRFTNCYGERGLLRFHLFSWSRNRTENSSSFGNRFPIAAAIRNCVLSVGRCSTKDEHHNISECADHTTEATSVCSILPPPPAIRQFRFANPAPGRVFPW